MYFALHSFQSCGKRGPHLRNVHGGFSDVCWTDCFLKSSQNCLNCRGRSECPRRLKWASWKFIINIDEVCLIASGSFFTIWPNILCLVKSIPLFCTHFILFTTWWLIWTNKINFVSFFGYIIVLLTIGTTETYKSINLTFFFMQKNTVIWFGCVGVVFFKYCIIISRRKVQFQRQKQSFQVKSCTWNGFK